MCVLKWYMMRWFPGRVTHMYVCAKSLQSWLTLCDSMDRRVHKDHGLTDHKSISS